jgi:hypothetical protein
MLGEMRFSVPALWSCAWEAPAAAEARGRRQREKLTRELPEGTADEIVLARAQALEAEEREHSASVVRSALQQIYFRDGPSRQAWGFKEIWMPRKANGWVAYDVVFPEAIYVHLTRHPFTFARSAADWDRVPFTRSFLRKLLVSWVDFQLASQARSETGRYCSLTYEALVADPRGQLAPVLERIGLAWDPACLAALKRGHACSLRHSPLPRGAIGLAAKIPGLARLMAEYGYELPSREDERRGRAASFPVVSRLGATQQRRILEGVSKVNYLAAWLGELGRRLSRARWKTPTFPNAPAGPPVGGTAWRLNPPFISDGVFGWVVHLSRAPELAGLAALADDLNEQRRSPVRLFEDGRLLGPGHDLHNAIRERGQGRYSHWLVGHDLLFSTSDNTDPNRNGRTYTIVIDPQGVPATSPKQTPAQLAYPGFPTQE